jgi:hypothetical protein
VKGSETDVSREGKAGKMVKMVEVGEVEVEVDED